MRFSGAGDAEVIAQQPQRWRLLRHPFPHVEGLLIIMTDGTLEVESSVDTEEV